MAFLPQRATMYDANFAPTVDATQPQYTQAFDMKGRELASFQFTLAGMTGTISVPVALQVSNAVPPNGAIPGVQSVNQGWAGQGANWQPPASSWVAVVDGSGNAVASTFTLNGTGILNAYTPFTGRWVRGAAAGPTTGVGGSLACDVFLNSPGQY